LSKNAFAQSQQLKYTDHFWYATFELDDKEMRKKEVRAFLTKNCPSALPIFQKSRNYETFAYITGIAGGFLVGWELDNMLQGKFKPAAFTGFGLVIVGGILENQSKKGYNKIVDIYNKNCQNKTSISLNWGVTQANNVGLYLSF
jgi:hypothetical protein